jgi:hypothetical protein
VHERVFAAWVTAMIRWSAVCSNAHAMTAVTASNANPASGVPRVRGHGETQSSATTDEVIKFYALAAIVGTPTETVTISRDPDDDRLHEAALAADADVMVSGDQDLLTSGASTRSAY